MPEVTEFIERFAAASGAPVRTGVNVTSVRGSGDGYRVTTSHGEIDCRAVVIASGACNRPSVPPLADSVPASVEQLTPFDYRDPAKLPDGGVLVVGASATGVQLAAEIQRSGRPVTLSVGEHVRLPRTYRGRDVLWWMDASGVWDQRYDEVEDLTRARRLPSPQLVGTPERTTLDLDALASIGVEMVGRWASRARRPRAVLRRPAQHVLAGGPQDGAAARHVRRVGIGWRARRRRSARRSASSRQACPPRRGCSLTCAAARSARSCGRRASGPSTAGSTSPWWTRRATYATTAACVDSPGLYALGLPVLRRRRSTFICGIEDDARAVIDHIAGYLATRG